MQQPMHKNTARDIARFKACGHKVGVTYAMSHIRADCPLSQYADLSEFGYGVALLSKFKYGFLCISNVLATSLLRAATAPDAEQDQGS